MFLLKFLEKDSFPAKQARVPLLPGASDDHKLYAHAWLSISRAHIIQSLTSILVSPECGMQDWTNPLNWPTFKSEF